MNAYKAFHQTNWVEMDYICGEPKSEIETHTIAWLAFVLRVGWQKRPQRTLPVTFNELQISVRLLFFILISFMLNRLCKCVEWKACKGLARIVHMATYSVEKSARKLFHSVFLCVSFLHGAFKLFVCLFVGWLVGT